MVRGSRVAISCGFKVNCALINISMEFFIGPITRRINVLHESRMKWTWHHSMLTVEEVSFFGGLRVVLLQLLSIHGGEVGVTDLGVMLLWPPLCKSILSKSLLDCFIYWITVIFDRCELRQHLWNINVIFNSLTKMKNEENNVISLVNPPQLIMAVCYLKTMKVRLQ